MSREDRRQRQMERDNAMLRNNAVADVVSEQIDEAEDSLVASNNRVADALDRIANLLTKLVKELSDEKPE